MGLSGLPTRILVFLSNRFSNQSDSSQDFAKIPGTYDNEYLHFRVLCSIDPKPAGLEGSAPGAAPSLLTKGSAPDPERELAIHTIDCVDKTVH